MKAARKKKTGRGRARRARLTHFEVRRDSRLRLRLAIADDAIDEVGDELGALFRKIAPGAAAHAAATRAEPEVIEVLSPLLEHETDDATYHMHVRSRLAELFSSLCNASLADAYEIAREECARRAEGN